MLLCYFSFVRSRRPPQITRSDTLFHPRPLFRSRASLCVAGEDWVNDGVPLAAPVARECLAGWYGRNGPARGAWHVAGRPVDPAEWRRPFLAVVPARDRIVPPPSAAALAASVPGAEDRKSTRLNSSH